MKKIIEYLSGKKTYILAVLGVLALVVKFLVGDISFIEFLNSQDFVYLLELLGLASLRAAISKILGIK